MNVHQKTLLTEDVAGLDITDSFVSAARVKTRSRGGFQIKNAGWMPVPEGADEQAIAATIKKLWKKCRINTYSVCSCFRSRRLNVKRFHYTDLDPEDLRATLTLEVESILRRSSETFHLDWQLEKERPENPGEINGTYVVAPRDEVDRHLRILKLAGLTPSSLDIAHASLTNLYLALHAAPASDESVGIIHTTEHTIDMVFITGGPTIHTQTLLSLNDTCAESTDYLFQNIKDAIEYARVKQGLGPLKELLLTGQPMASMELLSRIEMVLPHAARYWNPLDEENVRATGRGVTKEVLESGAAMLATSIGTALRRNIHHAAI